jgi:hypothetical protein
VNVLCEKAARAQALLVRQNPFFGEISKRQMMTLCLDESMTSRKELVLSCRSNKPLGSIGNAHLSTFVALKCFKERATAQMYQEVRDTRCSQVAKADHYDSWFKDAAGAVLLHWGFEERPEPSTRQKADFVDALIGLLVLTQRWSAVDWLCAQIVQ